MVKNNKDKSSLNSGAKAYVPPSTSTTSRKSSKGSGGKGKNAGNKGSSSSNANGGGRSKGNGGSNTAPSTTANAKATAAPAPTAPVAGAWGKNSSTVRAAPSAKPQAGGSSAGGWRNVSGGGNPRPGGGDDRKGSGDGGGNNNWRGGRGGGGDANRGDGRRGGNDHGGRGGDRGDRGDRGGDRERGGRRNGNHDRQDRGNRGRHNDGANNNDDGWKRGKSLPLELLCPGDGDTPPQKAVQRILLADLLGIRMSYLAPPLSWQSEGGTLPGPPDVCRWLSETRVADIDAMTKAERQSGDVSKRPKPKKPQHDTAPPLEDCKPLQVNNDTRWKSKVFNHTAASEDLASDEDVNKKALLILNKLSLTKFDKLSDLFIDSGIGNNEETLRGAIKMIVDKAQDEPHFSAMYAQLCLKLSITPMAFEECQEGAKKKGKKFKKILLEACQAEFEQDTDTKIADAVKDIPDQEEKDYRAGIIKKHYLGHMTFIGELFKGNLISIKIMLLCLPMLYEATTTANSADKDESPPRVDEEKIECFAKLMSTIGLNLEQESDILKAKGKNDAANQLAKCWKSVETMASRTKKKDQGPDVSNRIKFMLQDLMEMKQKGWVKRRKEETAKTIDEIHKEVRREERRNSTNNHHQGSMRKQSSTGDIQQYRRTSVQTPATIDKDGFTSVSTATGGGGGKSFGRTQSMSNMYRNNSDRSLNSTSKKQSNNDNRSRIERSASGSSFAAFNEKRPSSSSSSSSFRGGKKDQQQRKDSPQRRSTADQERSPTEPLEPPQLETEEGATPSSQSAVVYETPEDCGTKAKNILREFFIGGDTDDALLSIRELIGTVGSDGHTERGAEVVKKAVLLVLEMKQGDVDKFLSLYSKSFAEKSIAAPSIIAGLSEPLEFLEDIIIDAPLAKSHLAGIVGTFVTIGAVPFGFLLDTPDYFRTDCFAALFGCRVLRKMGGDALESAEYLEVIEKLMTDEDRGAFSSPKELLASTT